MPYTTFPIIIFGSLRLDLSNSYSTKKNYPPSFLMSTKIVTTMDAIGFV